MCYKRIFNSWETINRFTRSPNMSTYELLFSAESILWAKEAKLEKEDLSLLFEVSEKVLVNH